jgi:internalin A
LRSSDLEPLRGLANLQILICSQTLVSDLMPLQGLTRLQLLDCSSTKVSNLEPLQGLASLRILYCGNTKVSDLEPIVELEILQTLGCHNLKLSGFPRKLLFCENLEQLMLFGACIPGIPEEAFSSDQKQFFGFSNNCLPTLRAHVLDLEAEAIPINSVKILVLGNGRVGKTQLCRHLAAEPFDPTVPSTHGIASRTIPALTEGHLEKC